MTEPIEFPLPQATVLKTTTTADHSLTVTAGPRRSDTTISVPIGVHHVILDAQVSAGEITARLKMTSGGKVTYPIPYRKFVGTQSQMVKIIVDDTAWLEVQATQVWANAVGNTLVGVTIIQAGVT